MDEEYARKLQELEEELPHLSAASQEEEDFRLALQLSAQMAAESEQEDIPESPAQCEQLSEDYLFALSLQEELNEQQREYHTLLRQRNANSNVSLVTQYGRLFEEDSPVYDSQRDDEDDYNEEDDEEDEEYYLQMAAKPQKPHGRLAKGEIVTKHDKEICEARNTAILETQIGIDCGNMIDSSVALPNPVFNELNQHAARSETRRIRKTGKEDRETRESVMDSQTRLLLYKMLNANVIKEMSGIISSGKEANVYRAMAGDQPDVQYAIKIYKTTLNEFKNREEYIKDDYRFRYKFNKQSNRKFIKVWAEKEEENLRRMARCGIPCPEVVLLRKNILVMSFLGVGEHPAPQLRNITGLDENQMGDLFLQCARIMRTLFQRAHLIHGDLSEYNLLYHKGSLWVIDVAQAVEWEHPNALAFLRRDCDNMLKYFQRRGVRNLITTRELFNYITDVNITEDNEDDYLNTLLARCVERGDTLSLDEMQDEKVFMESFIPRHLDSITDPFAERDVHGDELKDVFHQSLTGLNSDLSGVATVPSILADQSSSVPEDHEDLPEEEREWIDRSDESLSPASMKAARKSAKKDFKTQQRQNRADKKSKDRV